jgi:hypothetical protein
MLLKLFVNVLQFNSLLVTCFNQIQKLAFVLNLLEFIFLTLAWFIVGSIRKLTIVFE